MHNFKTGQTVYDRQGVLGEGVINDVERQNICVRFRSGSSGWVGADQLTAIRPLVSSERRHRGFYYLTFVLVRLSSNSVAPNVDAQIKAEKAARRAEAQAAKLQARVAEAQAKADALRNAQAASGEDLASAVESAQNGDDSKRPKLSRNR